MALVDYERAWAELSEYVSGKPHHGSRDLALKMLELVACNSVEESLPERAFRLYGVQLHEDLRGAARQESVVPLPAQRERPPDSPRGSSAVTVTGVLAHSTTEGGHDGRWPEHDQQHRRTG